LKKRIDPAHAHSLYAAKKSALHQYEVSDDMWPISASDTKEKCCCVSLKTNKSFFPQGKKLYLWIFCICGAVRKQKQKHQGTHTEKGKETEKFPFLSMRQASLHVLKSKHTRGAPQLAHVCHANF
jgi:hypothetical protein